MQMYYVLIVMGVTNCSFLYVFFGDNNTLHV